MSAREIVLRGRSITRRWGGVVAVNDVSIELARKTAWVRQNIRSGFSREQNAVVIRRLPSLRPALANLGLGGMP